MKQKFRNGYISERLLSFSLSFIIIILTGTPLFSQDEGTKVSRQSSIDAFSKGDYEKAYSSFSELLMTYPKDQLYKYYSGVCLVKLNREPDKAATLLVEARQGGSMARIVPADAIYWQGRALQMSGKYAEAVECYNTFTQGSGKKAARDLGVPDYIEQCNREEGMLLSSAPPKPEKVNEAKPEPEPKPEIPAEKPVESVSRVDDSLKNIPAEKSFPAGYDSILSEAMVLHIRADSLYKLADSLKKNIEKLGFREKSELKSKIDYMENLAASLQVQADKKYEEAQAAMNATPFAQAIQKVKEIPAGKDSFPAEVKVAAPLEPAPGKESVVKKDSVITVQNAEKQIFSFFWISSKPDEIGEKVKVDGVIPPGLIYRIQLAVFMNPVQLSYFKGIRPIYGFRVAGTNKTNYYAGMFRRQADAARALSVVRQKGFRDSFVVSLSDGKPVSAERAAILEKEWGGKPFPVTVQPQIETPADTLPPTLAFRVEMMRSPKPVKEDILEGMKKFAGNRGLDSQKLSDGTIIYLVGYFITFDSAEEYADLLVKNGYRDAKVSAWLGKKEIPVETARKLFENLE
ncbi:MAG: hypothetical protein ABSA76_01645 [Bacteroidales bacterium]